MCCSGISDSSPNRRRRTERKLFLTAMFLPTRCRGSSHWLVCSTRLHSLAEYGSKSLSNFKSARKRNNPNDEVAIAILVPWSRQSSGGVSGGVDVDEWRWICLAKSTVGE